MIKLKIDHREVEVEPGTTVLGAARKLGIDVPTLCFMEGLPASTSCQVCSVKLRPSGRVVPSCGTVASEGMEIESETEEVHHLRRTALELLLSDHVGDCYAPCDFACPAHMDVPLMLRQIKQQELHEAIVTVKRDIGIPAILGRVCPKPCEKGCRRGGADGPVAICQLKRFAADVDLASGKPYVPACDPPTHKRVAVIGAGPTGLCAAFYLAQRGHECTLFDDQRELGGRLRHECSPDELPRDILEAEIAALLSVGIAVRSGTRVGDGLSFAGLRSQFDAVLIACGATAKDDASAWGIAVGPRGVQVSKETYATNVDGVFAAGNAIRLKGMVVRSAADGRESAHAIHQYLSGYFVSGPVKRFSSRIGRVDAGELPEFMACAGSTPLAEPSSDTVGYNAEEAIAQADRCMHCDCRALESCTLRYYSEKYGADPGRYPSTRRPFQQILQPSNVIFEPGKCINCGLCIAIVERAGEPLGLSFIGRGFDVRVGVPFGRTFDEALGKVAAECVTACPTAALSFRETLDPKHLPILPPR